MMNKPRLNSEIRKDPVSGRWVIIGKDKGYVPAVGEHITKTNIKNCPFCAGNESCTPTEIMRVPDNNDDSKWRIRVIPNKYPALVIEGKVKKEGIGIFDRMNGVGAHEIVIEAPEHTKTITDLADDEYFDVLKVFQARMLDLKKDERFRYILLFKNEGIAAGASLEHSHSQFIATPIVPKRVAEEISGSKFYYNYKKRCIFCDIIQLEKKFFQERIVYENNSVIVISPFAARFPFEMWVLPKEHVSSFEESNGELLKYMSNAILTSLKALNRVLENPPYNIILHSSPVTNNCEREYHYHFEIIPKVKKIAGFEWGTGFYINPVSPEEAAGYLRKAGNL